MNPMKQVKFVLLFVTAFASQSLFAQSRATIEAYILKYRDIAIEEMQRTGVPASITLAQGVHETGAGTSNLVLKSNNHFGIKCKTEWEGEKVYHDDDARGECFRKYNDPTISYRDHSDFLRTRSYYSSLFNLDPTDYEAWAFGLKKAGYATNPKYPQILIKLIRDYNLQDYTLVALGRKQKEVASPDWAKNAEVFTEPEVAFAVSKTVYPQGIFKINDTKVIFIAKGTSYLKVAEEADISLSRLLDFNDMKDGDVAPTDGLLFLQRKRKTGVNETHVVSSGETLYDIAQAEGIRLESLLQYNFLMPGVQVEAGEKLYLTETAPAMPKLAPQKPAFTKAVYKTPETAMVANTEEDYLLHVVQPKETVYSIAKKYEAGIEDVKKWNELSTNDLKIGQQVRIKQTR
ncbi:MAG: LysM peptidoglycan-binding protein [Flavisolibacter sp.]|jgi:LysM repeat protein|nr:LysM peptidoglycan-binding protein [Flavisolibacter sp.]